MFANISHITLVGEDTFWVQNTVNMLDILISNMLDILISINMKII
jgi:hypothetical protein